jgi:hypothetical protein
VGSWFFGAVLSLYVVSLLKNQLGPGQRILRADAAAGSVHAIRVRFRAPVERSTGNSVTPFAAYCLEPAPESEADRQPTIRPTDTAFAVAPLPRPSRYFPKAHALHLSSAAVGALLAVPFLLGAVPHWAGMLLGVFSGLVGLFARMTLGGRGADRDPWTVRTASHPSPR